MTPEEELLQRLLETADLEGYELHGEPYTDAWGSGQWVKVQVDGEERYLQIQVIRHR